jgi:hypothetical protein
MITEYKIDYSRHGQTPLPLGVSPSAKVAVIGNGPSLLGSKLGSVIDSCDEVIRFNSFSLAGHEQDTGTRTTIWSLAGPNQRPVNPDLRPAKVIYCHGPNSKTFYEPAQTWPIPRAFYNNIRQRIQSESTRPDPEKLLPSTGFLTLAWLIEAGFSNLHIAGFDSFQKDRSGLHHYWVNRAYRTPTEHDGNWEREQIGIWGGTGKIRHLSQSEPVKPKGGVGTELKKLLGYVGIVAVGNCNCNRHAKEMDTKGPDWCEQNLDTITGWLKQEASLRRLPFSAMVARRVVKIAIHRARINSLIT